MLTALGPRPPEAVLRRGRTLGQFRIERRIGQGGYATVYRARDTVADRAVALKVPHPHLLHPDALAGFRREARLVARLDHPNVLPLRTADVLEGRLVLVYPLGRESLEDRLRHRVPVPEALDLAAQLLEGLAHVHAQGIVHCDVKPGNVILFPDRTLRLSDFGIARLARRRITSTGTGTFDYMAPEQAEGRPLQASDVYAAGLVVHELLTGALPAGDPGNDPAVERELRRLLPGPARAWLTRSIEPDPALRYAHAGAMLAAYSRVRPTILARHTRLRRRRAPRPAATTPWQDARYREFRRRHGRGLSATFRCSACDGPLSEAMMACPWCGADHRVHRLAGGAPTARRACPRCGRGLRSDWRFCPWCYGGATAESTGRARPDSRGAARCLRASCRCDGIRPFTRYCPYCRAKVHQAWPLPGTDERCRSCGWGVATDLWAHCAWCAGPLDRS